MGIVLSMLPVSTLQDGTRRGWNGLELLQVPSNLRVPGPLELIS